MTALLGGMGLDFTLKHDQRVEGLGQVGLLLVDEEQRWHDWR
jgi:hypothetical protein